MFVVAAVAWAVAWRFLPSGGRYAPDAPPERGSFAVVRRDHAFLLFVGAMALASMTYVAFDSLLAISLVDSHGFSPATWGFIVVINPILVTFVQLRLTRSVAGVSRAGEARGRDAADGRAVRAARGRTTRCRSWRCSCSCS